MKWKKPSIIKREKENKRNLFEQDFPYFKFVFSFDGRLFPDDG